MSIREAQDRPRNRPRRHSRQDSLFTAIRYPYNGDIWLCQNAVERILLFLSAASLVVQSVRSLLATINFSTSKQQFVHLQVLLARQAHGSSGNDRIPVIVAELEGEFCISLAREEAEVEGWSKEDRKSSKMRNGEHAASFRSSYWRSTRWRSSGQRGSVT